MFRYETWTLRIKFSLQLEWINRGLLSDASIDQTRKSRLQRIMKSESVSEAEEIEERAANTDVGDNWDLEMVNLANYLNARDRRSTIDVEDHSILAAVMSDEQTYNSMSALSEISSLMNSDRFWEELEVMNREVTPVRKICYFDNTHLI